MNRVQLLRGDMSTSADDCERVRSSGTHRPHTTPNGASRKNQIKLNV
ncbi:hypothetical protein N665_2841s0004 [Sinapis alba]|nr:hypothetical protein N665_2841s0004 [Sinapis alba]